MDINEHSEYIVPIHFFQSLINIILSSIGLALMENMATKFEMNLLIAILSFSLLSHLPGISVIVFILIEFCSKVTPKKRRKTAEECIREDGLHTARNI